MNVRIILVDGVNSLDFMEVICYNAERGAVYWRVSAHRVQKSSFVGVKCDQDSCVYFAGRLCEVDVDDCVGDPCEHDGTCDDLVNGFTCRCLPGFTGKLCSQIISPVNNVVSSSYVMYQPVDQSSDQVSY